MKKTIVLLACFMLILFGIRISFAQGDNNKEIYGNYLWNTPVVMEYCDINGNKEDGKVLSISGQKFTIFDETDSHYIIRVWDYPNLSSFRKYNYRSKYVDIRFLLQEGLLNFSRVEEAKNSLKAKKMNKIDSLDLKYLEKLQAGEIDFLSMSLIKKYNLIDLDKKTQKDTSKNNDDKSIYLKILSNDSFESEQKKAITILKKIRDLKPENQAYFRVKKKDVQLHATKYDVYKSALAVGVLNYPFKLRLQRGSNKDFGGSFNIGVALGVKFKHKSTRNFTHSIISGYGISTLILDTSSVSKNASNLAGNNNFNALSLSLGYLIENKKIQAGVFIGIDKLNKINQDTYGWKYNGEPWFSIGFGYSIFSNETKKSNVGAKND